MSKMSKDQSHFLFGRFTKISEYLAAVFSHGVVVEAGLGPELLVALLALQGVLELQGLKATYSKKLK